MPPRVITEPGIYPDLPNSDYHEQRDVLSSSVARRLLSECPAKVRYGEVKETQALNLGRAAHMWCLEGEKRFRETFHVVHAPLTTKAGKAEAAEAERTGRAILRKHEFDTVQAMKAALEAHPTAKHAYLDGTPEVSLFWRDPEFGILCRCRPDFLPTEGRIVSDYKSARSAHPEDFKRSVVEYGYHAQAAWYLEGLRACGILEDPRFLFVVQEKEPPYIVSCIAVNRSWIEMGNVENRKAKEIFARCLETGHWPGYADDEVAVIEAPKWAQDRFDWRHSEGFYTVDERPASVRDDATREIVA